LPHQRLRSIPIPVKNNTLLASAHPAFPGIIKNLSADQAPATAKNENPPTEAAGVMIDL